MIPYSTACNYWDGSFDHGGSYCPLLASQALADKVRDDTLLCRCCRYLKYRERYCNLYKRTCLGRIALPTHCNSGFLLVFRLNASLSALTHIRDFVCVPEWWGPQMMVEWDKGHLNDLRWYALGLWCTVWFFAGGWWKRHRKASSFPRTTDQQINWWYSMPGQCKLIWGG